jgi:N-acetylmuramoyl-L-alanine amidase
MKKILLIAGHGDGDCGAVGCGYQEANLTRVMVNLVKHYLDEYADVEIASTSKNWYKYICKEKNTFNFKPYDYVLEIHFNACVNDAKGNGKTTGTEIYVTTSEKGTSVEEGIVKNISKLGLTNRGVKKKNWSLIHHIKSQGVSSALLEICFIDDADDMYIYSSKREDIAKAIAKGIVDGFGLQAKDLGLQDISGHYAEDYIKDLYEMGIVKGDGNGNYKPDENLKRGDAAIMIRNAIKFITGK